MAYGQVTATETDVIKIVRGYGLDDRPLNAVINFLNGSTKEEACLDAGYAKGSSGMVFRSAKVQAALAAVIDRHLVGELAPGAIHVLSRLLYDERVAAGVRSNIAFGLLDRAGFTAKRHEKAGGDARDPSQLNPAELQAQIDKLQREIDGRMRDVTPNDAPNTTQVLDMFP